MSQYIKNKILWYFYNKEEIIQGQLLTGMFHDSLLPYVDDFVKVYEKGYWKPTIMATGFPNWYGEFLDYLKSIDVKVMFK